MVFGIFLQKIFRDFPDKNPLDIREDFCVSSFMLYGHSEFISESMIPSGFPPMWE